MTQVRKFILSFVIFVGICYLGLTWFINSQVEKGLNDSVAAVEGLTLTYSDLAVSIMDLCVSLKDVEITLPQGQRLTADEVRIISFDQLNPVPHYVTAEASGMVINATPANVGSWAMSMKAMDIPVVKADVSLDYEYDPKLMTLSLNELAIKSRELADANLSCTIDGLDLQHLRVEKMFGLRIGTTELSLSNHSLIDKLIQTAARGLNVSKADTLTQISAELTSMAKYAGKDENLIAKKALRGLSIYLNDPGSVTITARPVEPIPLLYFFMGRDIYENLRAMNIEIKTDSSEDI